MRAGRRHVRAPCCRLMRWPALEGRQLLLFGPSVFEVVVEFALAQVVWLGCELVRIVQWVYIMIEELEVRAPACQAQLAA